MSESLKDLKPEVVDIMQKFADNKLSQGECLSQLRATGLSEEMIHSLGPYWDLFYFS